MTCKEPLTLQKLSKPWTSISSFIKPRHLPDTPIPIWGESLDAFKSGQVAMAMNWFAFFPGLYADPNTGGDKIDFFVNPPQNQAGSTLGGQGISVVSYSEKKDAALEYIKWFSQPSVQAKWWELGGYSAHNSVLNDPGFVKSQPFAGDFLEAMGRRAGLLAGTSLC